MKTSLISILLILTLFSWGQKQKISNLEFSLLDQSNQWSVLDDFTSVHVYPTDPYSYFKSAWYKIGNDTTVNNIVCKKLMKSTDPLHLRWNVFGDLRKVGERIYYFDGQREILLYDFGLAVGDSIESPIYKGISYVSRLDFIRDTTLNNTVRKIYYLTEYPAMHPAKYREIWIEGIGSITDGLLRQTMLGITGGDFWHEYQLLCFHQNEALIYQSKKYKNCYYDVVDGISDLSVSPEDFQVSPNPSSGRFTIKLDGNQTDFQVEIISITGIIIKEFNSGFNTQMDIDLSLQKKGIYFLRLKNENGVVTKKIILE